jgi:hypothetical protein
MLLMLHTGVGRCSAWNSEAAAGAILVVAFGGQPPAQHTQDIDDITGKYHFLSADDTLGLLEEEGKLKGYIEILQGQEESDAVLSYDIISGSRKKDQVEFRTNTIHRKYYRFFGKAERGSGHAADDPDYLRLIGDVETVTVKGDNGQESVARTHVILKSLGKSERNEE